MWRIVSSLLLWVVLQTGCTTKSKARAQAQSAFMAGQLQALQRARQAQSAPPGSQPVPASSAGGVTIQGEVANPVVPWSVGLTLARALVAAEYRGVKDPSLILILRKGQAYQVNPRQLLDGVIDPVLEPGDVVELRP